MQWEHRESQYSHAPTGAATVVEAEPGPERDAGLGRWLSQARDAGAHTWRLSCAPEAGGIWAGLADLVGSLIPRIQDRAPDLVSAHGYEICLVLPRYRGQLDVSRPLTDTAAPKEQTRNYPADRAYRSLHGIIDLLGEWHARSGGEPWAVVCDDYDQANGLVHRFFSELLRRRGEQLGLNLLVVARPGEGWKMAAGFGSQLRGAFRPGWRGVAVVAPDPTVMAERAAALEAKLENDATNYEVDLPRLIHHWQSSTLPERALRWQVTAIHAFNHHGLYEASLPYADQIAANLERIRADDQRRYFVAVNGLFFCWVPLGQAERARQVVEEALAHLEASTLPRVYYLVSMLYARFLEPKDLEKAEQYLDRALRLVAEVYLDDDDRHFLTVFLMNGLALIRVRQNRAGDALALCQAGLDRLRHHLDPQQHRLHRSVLLYNIAQVYAQTGADDQAIEYFGQTMDMDPNYSEYYNERGALYYRTGRLELAEADFLAAIRLSPPYAEVWINLGQCYRAAGRMTEAVGAYSRALDLEPGSSLAWAGRAEAHATLGCHEQALADYQQALQLDPAQPLVWAGRAIVQYEQGHVSDALDDLDHAVSLAPDLAELRQNRAIALRDLGRMAEAADDLRSYLEMCPDSEDAELVAQELESLMVAPRI